MCVGVRWVCGVRCAVCVWEYVGGGVFVDTVILQFLFIKSEPLRRRRVEKLHFSSKRTPPPSINRVGDASAPPPPHTKCSINGRAGG